MIYVFCSTSDLQFRRIQRVAAGSFSSGFSGSIGPYLILSFSMKGHILRGGMAPCQWLTNKVNPYDHILELREDFPIFMKYFNEYTPDINRPNLLGIHADPVLPRHSGQTTGITPGGELLSTSLYKANLLNAIALEYQGERKGR